jgi:hypothetical protein
MSIYREVCITSAYRCMHFSEIQKSMGAYRGMHFSEIQKLMDAYREACIDGYISEGMYCNHVSMGMYQEAYFVNY